MKAEKLEEDLCRCCHSEGAVTEELVYCDMLRECYGIELVKLTDPLYHTLCTICDACIQRLRDAMEFKQQVQECEKVFRDLYLRPTIGNDEVEVDVDRQQEIKSLDPPVDDRGITHNFAVTGHGQDDNKLGGKGDYELKVDVYCQEVKNEPNVHPVVEDRSITDDDFAVTGHGQDEHNKLDDKVIKEPPPPASLRNDYKWVKRRFLCCRCEYNCATQEIMNQHLIKKHNIDQQFNCSFCSKKCVTQSPFVEYKLEEHIIDDRLKCTDCNKIFSTKFNLRKHKESFHKLGVKIKCDLCDYECFHSNNIKRHMRVHDNEKNFHCKFCRKSFKRKSALQCHEMIHTGDRRKVCKECGQAFVQKGSLNYHMAKYHPGVNS